MWSFVSLEVEEFNLYSDRSAINLSGVLVAAIFEIFKACLDKNLIELPIPQDLA